MQVGTLFLIPLLHSMEPTETAQSKMVADLAEAAGLDNLSFLSDSILGNTVLGWISTVVIFVAILFVLSILKRIVLKHLGKLSKLTKSNIDDAAIGFLREIGKFFYFSIALFAAVQHLSLPGVLDLIIKGMFFFSVVYEVIRLAEKFLEMIVAKKLGREDEEGQASLSAALSLILRIVLWTIGLLLILSNLGFNVTSLLASLGIGGLAVSLALQPLFSDIFSSFSIILDKPFEEGDYIVCGEFKGNVKRIGLKTTRLQALQGEELIISNAELTSARVQNFKKLTKRRIVFSIGLTYDTSPEKLRKARDIIEDVITKKEMAEFNRAHFFEFGDSSLNFEIVYYITSSEYADYMDTQQGINLEILDTFKKEGIHMAFPTSTVHMVKELE